MKKNELLRELVETAGISDRLVRELTSNDAFPVLNEVATGKRGIQVPLDYEDVELCFQNTKFIESYSASFTRPKRFTKHFWKKLSQFLHSSTLYARSGVFMIETGSALSERELTMIAEFYSEFSERFLQDADFFVGIGVKITPQVKHNLRFHAMSFYPHTAMLCESCYQKVAKHLVSINDEHVNTCPRCAQRAITVKAKQKAHK